MNEPLDNTTWIETPEQVRFRYHVAGPARRYLAYLLDLAVRLLILVAILACVVLAVGSEETALLGQGVLLVALFAVEWSYYVLCETLWNGRSIGKRALGLRVVKEGGFPLTFIDSVLRNLLRAADFLPLFYVLGVLSMVGDRRFRRLGDRVAGTMVISEDPIRSHARIGLAPALSQAELATLPGRPTLVADELEAIDLFLRRDALSPARRNELAALIAPGLSARMGVPYNDPVRFLALVHQRAQPDAACRTSA